MANEILFTYLVLVVSSFGWPSGEAKSQADVGVAGKDKKIDILQQDGIGCIDSAGKSRGFGSDQQ